MRTFIFNQNSIRSVHGRMIGFYVMIANHELIVNELNKSTLLFHIFVCAEKGFQPCGKLQLAHFLTNLSFTIIFRNEKVYHLISEF